VTARDASADTWHRLHPLSPVVRSGRRLLALLVLVAIATTGKHGGGAVIVDVCLVTVAAAAAVISWLVTRWRLDDATLRIETGLLRRDSRQLPVARIQAVDVVCPLLARWLGLAELQVRLAGSSSADGRLAYLTEQAAHDLRARLLAAHHGLDQATPEPPERVLAVVPAGRLVGSVVLTGATWVPIIVVAVELIALRVGGAAGVVAGAATGGTLTAYLIGLASVTWRRVSTQYGFTVAESPDGIRLRRGLLGTVAETIPLRRVQAVRMVEPLPWRPLGWCRLEVDVAGSRGRDRNEGPGRARRALLPVGPRDTAVSLLRIAVGNSTPQLTRPPRRARWKAPLSYHFLSAGHDAAIAVTVTGRFRRVTTWLPLDKAQSIRFVQGPVQRRFSLATVHLDAPGRRVRAQFAERDVREARRLTDELPAQCRAARIRVEQQRGPQPRGPQPRVEQQRGPQPRSEQQAGLRPDAPGTADSAAG
jgi:putative membrane protein